MHNPAVAFEAVAIGVDEFALTFLFGLAHTRPTTWIQNIPKLRNLPNNWEAGINPLFLFSSVMNCRGKPKTGNLLTAWHGSNRMSGFWQSLWLHLQIAKEHTKVARGHRQHTLCYTLEALWPPWLLLAQRLQNSLARDKRNVLTVKIFRATAGGKAVKVKSACWHPGHVNPANVAKRIAWSRSVPLKETPIADWQPSVRRRKINPRGCHSTQTACQERFLCACKATGSLTRPWKLWIRKDFLCYSWLKCM